MQLVLLIGLPGSGKSTFYRQNFAQTHRLISKDLLKNKKRKDRRQLKMLEEAFKSGQSVVLDNTHPSRESRAPWVAWALEKNWKVIGYYLSCSVEECRRRNEVRCDEDKVPDVGFFTILGELERPSPEEGFDQLFFVCDGRIEEWKDI